MIRRLYDTKCWHPLKQLQGALVCRPLATLTVVHFRKRKEPNYECLNKDNVNTMSESLFSEKALLALTQGPTDPFNWLPFPPSKINLRFGFCFVRGICLALIKSQMTVESAAFQVVNKDAVIHPPGTVTLVIWQRSIF